MNKPIKINKRFSITGEFFIAVYMAIEDNRKNLQKSVRYKAEKLCGKAFWSALSDGDKRLAGMCISELARYKLINLQEVKSVHEYPKRYQLI